MSTIDEGRAIAAVIRARGPAVERELIVELDKQAEIFARRVRREVPKFQSVLANSVHVEKPGSLERDVKTGTSYAEAVHEGVKAGKKGLPRFFDPRSRDIVQWLKSRPASRFVGPPGQYAKRAPRKGSRRYTEAELQLRDRYEGLAHHVRRHGIQGDPFMKRTQDALTGSVVAALRAAAARALNPDGEGWNV